MTYHTFYENENNIELNLKYNNYFRSSISRKTIKHCYEFTILMMSNDAIEAGFSCSYNQRTFVSIFQHNKGILHMINSQATFYSCNIKYQENDVIEVCYDSQTSYFSIIKGTSNCSQAFKFSNPITWFAYLDNGGLDGENKVSLNLGREEFINPLPQDIHHGSIKTSNKIGMIMILFSQYLNTVVVLHSFLFSSLNKFNLPIRRKASKFEKVLGIGMFN